MQSHEQLRRAFQGRPALMAPLDFAEALGIADRDRAHELLADLDLGELIEVVDAIGGVSITLSPRGAQQAGLTVLTTGRDRVWVDSEALDRGPISFLRVDPGDVRNARRDWAGVMACDGFGHPKPTVLLGSGMAWDSIPIPEGEPCPACRSRVLKDHEYCLKCETWGLESSNVDRRNRAASKSEAGHFQEIGAMPRKANDATQAILRPAPQGRRDPQDPEGQAA